MLKTSAADEAATVSTALPDFHRQVNAASYYIWSSSVEICINTQSFIKVRDDDEGKVQYLTHC